MRQKNLSNENLKTIGSNVKRVYKCIENFSDNIT